MQNYLKITTRFSPVSTPQLDFLNMFSGWCMQHCHLVHMFYFTCKFVDADEQTCHLLHVSRWKSTVISVCCYETSLKTAVWLFSLNTNGRWAKSYTSLEWLTVMQMAWSLWYLMAAWKPRPFLPVTVVILSPLAWRRTSLLVKDENENCFDFI